MLVFEFNIRYQGSLELRIGITPKPAIKYSPGFLWYWWTLSDAKLRIRLSVTGLCTWIQA